MFKRAVICLALIGCGADPLPNVLKVVDGDSIHVLDSNRKRVKVRLYGIDAPERKQPFGEESKAMLVSLVGDKAVTTDCPKKDRYGRSVCVVWVGDMDVNRAMVEQGGAWVYSQYYKGLDYYEAENTARQKRAGLWQADNPVPPWEWRRK